MDTYIGDKSILDNKLLNIPVKRRLVATIMIPLTMVALAEVILVIVYMYIEKRTLSLMVFTTLGGLVTIIGLGEIIGLFFAWSNRNIYNVYRRMRQLESKGITLSLTLNSMEEVSNLNSTRLGDCLIKNMDSLDKYIDKAINRKDTVNHIYKVLLKLLDIADGVGESITDIDLKMINKIYSMAVCKCEKYDNITIIAGYSNNENTMSKTFDVTLDSLINARDNLEAKRKNKSNEEWNNWRKQQEQARQREYERGTSQSESGYHRGGNANNKLNYALALYGMKIPYTMDELRKKKRELLRKEHPDENKRGSDKRAKEITDAFSELQKYADR